MMTWTGKVVGAVAGWAVAGPVGGMLGALVGHQFDRGLADRLGAAYRTIRLDPQAIQGVFFSTSFAVMGHLAKADGRVSEPEIRAARSIMHGMRLTPEQVRAAIGHFNQGKDPGFPITEQLHRLRTAIGGRPDLCRAFVEIQMQALLATPGIKKRERDILWHVARELGIGRVELAQIEALIRGRGRFANGPRRDDPEQLAKAYAALGVAPSANDKEVKTAYRRLMNQHHPDKLVAKGLPESMMTVAKEKTREIRAAYDLIKARRGMK
ncbi:MAG: co-chaperone DjlA [Gammaproteobacteria bacterium]|nr:co-chaperone DjlA [Gammaproteobacteria bacterium]